MAGALATKPLPTLPEETADTTACTLSVVGREAAAVGRRVQWIIGGRDYCRIAHIAATFVRVVDKSMEEVDGARGTWRRAGILCTVWWRERSSVARVLARLNGGMRKRVSIFASLKKICLGLNAVRGWVEGGMDDVALPFERCLKVERTLDMWNGWKWFVAPQIERTGIGLGMGLNLDAMFLWKRGIVGGDSGDVCRVGIS